MDQIPGIKLVSEEVSEQEVRSLAYEHAAKEVLRLVAFFEGLFVRHRLYCDTIITVKDYQFRWRTASRGFEYKVFDSTDVWSPVKNVFNMEIAAVFLDCIGLLYESACGEQERITGVLEGAIGTGNQFADRVVGKE
mgnify:CR=1 FL=1